jgi:hypothetical protein
MRENILIIWRKSIKKREIVGVIRAAVAAVAAGG